MKIVDVNDFKAIKKVKVVEKDLKEVQKLLTNCIETLRTHKKYIPVMESISVLHNSRTLVEVNLKKCEAFIKKYNEGGK